MSLRLSRRSGIGLLVAAVTVVAITAGIGTAISATITGQAGPRMAPADLSQLNTGPFPKAPTDFRPEIDYTDDVYAIESRRMMSYLADPYDIDPDLTYLADVAVLEPTDSIFNDDTGLVPGLLPAAFLPVVERNHMISGVLIGRDNDRTRGKKNMTIAVIRFPTDDVARTAANELYAALEQPGRHSVPIDAPSARGVSTTDAKGQVYATHGRYVIVGQALIPQPDPTALAARLSSLVQVQLSKMANLIPTPLREILDLPGDRDPIMSLALPETPDTDFSDTQHSELFGVYDAAARLHFERDAGPMRQAFVDSGVDLVAHHVGTVYRTRDLTAAFGLQQVLTKLGRDDEIVAGPPGITDARCIKLDDSEPLRNHRFLCAVVYDRYVAVVGTTTKSNGGFDASFYQQVAAQYSMLAQAG